jgi:DNA-binding response OmpR family regulator
VLVGYGERVRILLVEDEAGLRDVTRRGLALHGLAVDEAADGKEALYKLGYNDYDVVVLDRDLPHVHGDDVCRSIVASGSGIRVLMLTAAAETTDLVEGLAIGADDYLRKPFEMDELLARVVALGRRSASTRPPEMGWADIRLDSSRRTTSRAGVEVKLTRKEFGVLEVLMAGQGAAVTAEQILERVWDENIDPFTNVLRITMMTLRRKLGEPALIETIVGMGYRLTEPTPTEPASATSKP